MSFTSTVPAVVPLLRHSSCPRFGDWAEKKSSSPNAAVDTMLEPGRPRWMSRSMAVPAAVPSLTHSSGPCFLSLATKNSFVPTAVKWDG